MTRSAPCVYYSVLFVLVFRYLVITRLHQMVRTLVCISCSLFQHAVFIVYILFITKTLLSQICISLIHKYTYTYEHGPLTVYSFRFTLMMKHQSFLQIIINLIYEFDLKIQLHIHIITTNFLLNCFHLSNDVLNRLG